MPVFEMIKVLKTVKNQEIAFVNQDSEEDVVRDVLQDTVTIQLVNHVHAIVLEVLTSIRVMEQVVSVKRMLRESIVIDVKLEQFIYLLRINWVVKHVSALD